MKQRTISIDRWNQICHEEVMWTLRTMSGTEGDDRTPVVAMIVMSVDSYNQAVSVEVAEPLRSAEGGDTKPKVLIVKDEQSADFKSKRFAR